MSLFADFLWRLLVIVALSSGLVFGAFALAEPILRNISGAVYNRAAKFSLAGLAAVFAAAVGLLLSVDQEIQASCFGNFAATQNSFGITRILGLTWLATAFAAFFLDGVRYLRFSREIRKRRLATADGFDVVADSLPAFSRGIFRRTILIPRRYLGHASQLEHVLRHEQTHIRNHDGAWSLLALLVQRACWFNPLAFLFERGRRLAMEMATDEETLRRHGFSVTAYAETLLEALLPEKTRFDRTVVGAALRYSELKARLENLGRPAERPRRPALAVAISVLALGWFFGVGESLASIRTSAAPQEEIGMCSQVRHEKWIESWLQAGEKPEPNKCE